MSVPRPISVLVVDDHDSLRRSIVATLNDEPDINVIGEAKNGVECVDLVKSLSPDIVVMDIVMPLMNGLLATERIRNGNEPSKVIIISNYDEETYVHSCMNGGANGYVLKEAVVSDLPRAIRVVYNGGHFFTQRIAQQIVGFYLQNIASTV